jgi:hypothetical protein
MTIPRHMPVLTNSKQLITFSHCSFHKIITFENWSVEYAIEGCRELLQPCSTGANQLSMEHW